MKPLNLVIIKLTLCLGIGIALSYIFSITLIQSIWLTIFAFSAQCITFLVVRHQFKKTIWFGLFTYILLCCIGSLIHNLHHQRNFQNHYTKHISPDNQVQNCFIFRINKCLKPNTYNDKYIVELLKINGSPMNGKLLLNIGKDSLQSKYKVDDILVTYGNLRGIHSPLNPYQFDYKAYLEKQYIYHQITTKNTSVLKLDSEIRTLSGYAASFRDLINTKLMQFNFKAEELAIINAILLGQRQDMSKAIYDSYTKAGAIHILAVSGLHIGIILLILNAILKPMEHLKRGKPIKVCIIIVLLWSFAIIAGLSASVTRAVTMFSIVAIGMHWKRPSNVYNSLCISAFLLLLYKPMFLFDIGFQMSYIAVIAIVSVQPIFAGLWKPRWKITNYLWQIFTVTLAAQLGVFPISLYYFHQFPGLFLVSNLAIVPFLGIILGFGILIIALALVNSLHQTMAGLYGYIISAMNLIIDWVAKQESFLIKNVSFGIIHVVACYFVIITAVILWKKPSFRSLASFLAAILLAQGVWIFNDRNTSGHSFTIFHKSRHTLLGYKKNSSLKLSHNLDSLAISKDKVISNYCTGLFIDRVEHTALESVFLYQGKTILVIDSLGAYNVKSFRPDYVLLRNSPQLNLERMIDSIHPKYIIADGSNYRSYIKHWESTCLKRRLPFHDTGKKGAFIIK